VLLEHKGASPLIARVGKPEDICIRVQDHSEEFLKDVHQLAQLAPKGVLFPCHSRPGSTGLGFCSGGEGRAPLRTSCRNQETVSPASNLLISTVRDSLIITDPGVVPECGTFTSLFVALLRRLRRLGGLPLNSIPSHLGVYSDSQFFN
jgi:hypothetical protein